MEEPPYSNRELDQKFGEVHDKLNLILEQTTVTNGKVRKIIIAMVLIGGVLIGQTATNWHDLIGLVAGLIH